MESITALAMISGASVAVTQLGIHGPGLSRKIGSGLMSWKTYGKWYSFAANPSACQCISTWLFSQQHQIDSCNSKVELAYVYENKEEGANFRYMFDIPRFNKPFKMKCLYGTIYIVPRSLDNTNLCGYYIYTYRRGWSTGWVKSNKKISMLNFFLADLFRTANYTPLKSIPEPKIKYPIAYAQFPKEYQKFLRDKGKLSQSCSYSGIE